MSKLPKFNRLLGVLSLLLLSSNVFADTSSNDIINNLGSLIKAPKTYPSCTMQDGYWAEQSGDDTVAPPKVLQHDVVIQADQVTGQESGVHYVEGHVLGYKDDKTITADWLIYNQQSSRSVGGNVVLTRQYNVMQGKWIDYYFDLDKGVIKDANAKDYTSNMYAEGKQIDIYSKDLFKVESGFFTSCNPNDPDWHIEAKTMDFDYQDSQGTARNATLYAESIPVMYTPFMQFPLGKRRSGF